MFHLLQEEAVLKELVHLPKLLELPRFMISTFNRKLETVETDKTSAKEFLLKQRTSGQSLKPLVKTLSGVFDKLKLKLFAHGWCV